MDLIRLLILVIAIMLLFGGLGGHYWGWGGSGYSTFSGPGIGLGTILLIIVLIWFFR